MLCVGYDDTDPNNRYWIMLNSWGASPGRPNGLFRMNMDMDYSCSYKGLGYAFYWMTLDIDYGQANRPPDMPARPSGSTGAALGSLYSYSTIEKRSRWRPGEVYLWLGRRIHFSHGPGRIRHKCGGVTFLEQSWKISGQGHGHGQQWRRFRLVERPDNNRKCKQASGRTKKAHRVCQGLYRISLWIHHQCKRSRGRPDEYTFDWGDESTFDWGDGAISVTSYKSSGNTARVSHRWRKAGTYQVKAMTTDRKSASSGWSKPLTVTVA